MFSFLKNLQLDSFLNSKHLDITSFFLILNSSLRFLHKRNIFNLSHVNHCHFPTSFSKFLPHSTVRKIGLILWQNCVMVKGGTRHRKERLEDMDLYSMLMCYSTLYLIHFPYHVLSAASFLKLFFASLPPDGAFSSRVVRHHQKICRHKNLIQKSFLEKPSNHIRKVSIWFYFSHSLS